jgi:Tol biopolymer transport system component
MKKVNVRAAISTLGLCLSLATGTILSRGTALCLPTALAIGTALSTTGAATAQSKVVPPNQWFNKPEYSPDGSKVAVTTPPPTIVEANSLRDKVYDGQRGYRRKSIVILNANDFSLITEIESEVWPTWSPDGKYICATDFGRQAGRPHSCQDLGIYDASNGAKLRSIKNKPPVAYAWSPDSKRLALAHKDAISILDIENKQETSLAVKVNENSFLLPRWSPDGQFIAACFAPKLDREAIAASSKLELIDKQKRALRIWDVKSKEEKAKINLKAGTGMFNWSPSGKLFIYSEPKAIRVLDADSKKEITAIKTKEKKAVPFDWSHDKTKFSYLDGSVFHILDATTMKETVRIAAPTGGYMNIDWSADDNFILISAQNTAAICDAKSGRYIGYKTWPDAIRHTISPDQKLLIVEGYTCLTESEPISLPPAQGMSPFKDGKTGSPTWQ